MAAVTTELKVLVKAVGKGEIDKLSKALNDLGSKAAQPVNQKLKSSVAELKKLSSQSATTRNNVRGFSSAFKELANNLEVGSREFKEATAEAARLDAQLRKLQTRKPPSAGQRLAGAARSAGAIAAGGIFGGPEGAVGAGIGAIAKGPAGAAVGAVLGAQVGLLRKQAGVLSEVVAGYNKYQIALAGVSKDQKDFNQSINAAKTFSEQFVVPLDQTIANYTKLKASVVGAGLGTEETNKAFEALSASVLSTGGDTEDLNAALRAASQVFSKGKVSAEELRQQIGERLPGAFTIFADSMGISTKELDKLLEQGKVDLIDFVGFTEQLIARYGSTAEELAKAPELAGQRLQVALTNATLAYGGFFQKVGSGFQNYLTDLLNFATENKTQFLKIVANVAAFGVDIFEQVKNAAKNIATPFIAAFSVIEVKIENLRVQFDLLFKAAEAFGNLVLRADGFGDVDLPPSGRASVQERSSAILAQLEDLFGEFTPSKFGLGLRDSALSLGEDSDTGGDTAQSKMKTTSKELLDLAIARNAALQEGNAIRVAQLDYATSLQRITERFNAGEIDFNTAKKLDLDAQNKLIKTGLRLRAQEKKNLADLSKGQNNLTKELSEADKLFKSMANTVASGLTNAIMSLVDGTKSLGESLSNILKQLGSMFLQFGLKSLVGGLFADGGVVANNKVVPFAYGGVVDKPTLFPMANGAGLMGEAGPEAIMPLRRTASGRLGVEASGGGVGNVVVNVDAKGTSAQGDGPSANQLGKAIGAAVQAELIKQQRPGGLLSR